MNNDPNDLLPGPVREALDKGHKLEAIKLLREATGMGLAEAKALVENQARGVRPGGVLQDPGAVAEALEKGDRIEAIKRLREQTGMGLKEAKDAVDTLARDFRKAKAAPAEKVLSRLSAGWLLVLVVAGMLAWYFLTGS